MNKSAFIFLLCFICFKQHAQNYYFDSVIIGKYYGVSYRYDATDTTQFTKCTNDTLTVDEGNNPQGVYLHSSDICWGIAQGNDFPKYYSDTSFVRLPVGSCECFNGKYFGFNDSLKLKYYSLPDWSVFYRFYGRKYWSPVTGWVGIQSHAKKEAIFELYPNPAASKVSIVFGDGYLPYNRQGEVLDLNGKKVMAFEFPTNGGSAVIDVSGLKEGVYMVKVNDHDRTITKRLVVIR